MKTLKLEDWDDIPQGYTGIIEWEYGSKGWYKNGKLHREDGPAWTRVSGFNEWWLDGKCYWIYEATLDLTNKFILSKVQHPEYPTVQVWKILDKDKVYEQIIIPRMEEFITE